MSVAPGRGVPWAQRTRCRVARNLARIMVDDAAAKPTSAGPGGGPQAFGSRRRHHSTAAAVHTAQEIWIDRSACRAVAATAASMGK